MRRRLATSLHVGLLLSALGVVAWASGRPFVFPSLGPTAFVLAFERRGGRTRARRVVVSHLLGGVAGLLAWSSLAAGASLAAPPPPLSVEGVRLAASATVSTVLTSWTMLATDSVHPPACATTLIVSLGLLSTPLRVGIVVASVVCLVVVHAAALSAFDVAADARQRATGATRD